MYRWYECCCPDAMYRFGRERERGRERENLRALPWPTEIGVEAPSIDYRWEGKVPLSIESSPKERRREEEEPRHRRVHE